MSKNENKSDLKVRVLTYNIYLRPPPIKENEDDYKNERMNVFLEE
jgi:hypothetical protein